MNRDDMGEGSANRQGADSQTMPPDAPLPEVFAIVAGYGLPGRSLVDFLRQSNVSYRVIELNAAACERCSATGLDMVVGDASDLETLRRAGVERASLVALMVPNDQVVLEAVANVRRLNSKAQIIARCAFTSTGLEAMRRGADQTIVAEQVVAREAVNLARPLLKA